MNQKQTFLPESLYSMDSEITLEKISILCKTQTPIVGTVMRLDSENERFEVYLGKGIYGYMAFTESTIYPIFRDDNSLSPDVYTLVGKKIRAIILSTTSGITLSRKRNMQNALKYLINNNVTTIPYAEITAFSKLSAFIDIGEGICGRCYGKDFASTIYRNIKDIDIEKNSLVSVKIIDFNTETKHFNLSRVALIPNISQIYNEGDFVTCKIFSQLDNLGYYVLINNNYKGILDSKRERLYYGDIVTALVKRITTKGTHLQFIDYAEV